jgi:hypothetical protein
MIGELRRAFASGRSVAGEALLAEALAAGLPWDVVTRAVAEGVAHHYGTRVLSDEELGGSLVLA